MVKTFQDLKCWKQGREVRLKIQEVCKKFPSDEKYRLVDQIKRSSRSVTNNIAEGYGRFHYLENAQFCRQARGSLYETIDHLNIALDEKYLTKEEVEELNALIYNAISILNGFINYLLKAKEKTINN